MKRLVFCGIVLMITSCATEKPNFSPLSTSFYSNTKGSDSNKNIFSSVDATVKENTTAAEISNLIATFPSFNNNALNDEITVLKYSLQNYLYAVGINNTSGKKKAIRNFERSYKKVQKLRKSLNNDENEILNRYLVRIKTNVSVIEDDTKGI